MAINGLAVAAVTAGGIFAWSAITGKDVLKVTQGLVVGTDPRTIPQGYPITQPADLPPDIKAGAQAAQGGNAAPALFTGATGSAIADAALKYLGKVPYRWGGGSPVTGWDCSGFVNYVLGHDLGYTLPGGVKGFDGSSHGPIVPQYAFWSQAVTVPRAQALAGDIVCYGAGFSHMGIAISNADVINAYDFGHVTEIDPLDKAGPYPPLVKRIKTMTLFA